MTNLLERECPCATRVPEAKDSSDSISSRLGVTLSRRRFRCGGVSAILSVPQWVYPLSHRVSPSGIPTPDIPLGSSRVRSSSGLSPGSSGFNEGRERALASAWSLSDELNLGDQAVRFDDGGPVIWTGGAGLLGAEDWKSRSSPSLRQGIFIGLRWPGQKRHWWGLRKTAFLEVLQRHKIPAQKEIWLWSNNRAQQPGCAGVRVGGGVCRKINLSAKPAPTDWVDL